jgi:hypothetical protein
MQKWRPPPPFEGWWTHPFERDEDWRPQEVKDASGAVHTVMVRDEKRLRAREAAFERLLDQLTKDFKIDDRAKLKAYIEVAARIYGHAPEELSDRDRARLVKFAPRLAGLLRQKAIAIENIITNFDQQRVGGFDPKFCKSAYDQSEVDALMTRIWDASHTLTELAGILSQHRPRGRSPNAGLHGAVALLRDYWERELGRKLKSSPWKRGFPWFLNDVFEFIDRATVAKLPSAVKRRLHVSDRIPS